MGPPTIQRAGPADWERVRDVRLAALLDAPDAFAITHAEEALRTPESWRDRLAAPEAATFLARVGARDVGLIVGAPYDGETDALGLYAMWVDPDVRRRGVAGALVAAVVGWARERGARRLVLDVGDHNDAATRLYEGRGFRRTGKVGVLSPERPHVLEHQRALAL